MPKRKPKFTPEQRRDNYARMAPIGTPVRYYPKLPCGEDDFERSVIRSEPWILGHGDVVVAIEGFSGGKSIDHVLPIMKG